MASMVSVEQFFEDTNKMAEDLGDKLAGIDGIMQFDFSEDDNGCWYIEFVDGKTTMGSGVAENPTMTVTAPFETFYKTWTGQLKPEEVFPTGKVKISGDATFTDRLSEAGLMM